MKKDKFGPYSIPIYAINYLINGVPTGLTKRDIANIEAWLGDKNGPVVVVPSDEWLENDSVFFTWFPEFGEPCNCFECDLYF